MGTDIGYLQIKIRELQEKQEEQEKKIEDSLNREKELKNHLAQLFLEAKQIQIDSIKQTTEEIIHTTFKEQFKKIFDKQTDDFNENTILQAKGLNHLIDCLLTEIAILKQDIAFWINVSVLKSKISNEEIKKLNNKFQKIYPLKNVIQELQKYKLKNFSNKEKVKKILGEKNS